MSDSLFANVDMSVTASALVLIEMIRIVNVIFKYELPGCKVSE